MDAYTGKVDIFTVTTRSQPQNTVGTRSEQKESGDKKSKETKPKSEAKPKAESKQAPEKASVAAPTPAAVAPKATLAAKLPPDVSFARKATVVYEAVVHASLQSPPLSTIAVAYLLQVYIRLVLSSFGLFTG